MSRASAKSSAVLLAILLATLHVAHVTGLRNVLAIVVTLWALVGLASARSWPPLAWPLLAWLAWCAMSALWSLQPDISLKSALYDVGMPAGALYGAYIVSRENAGFRALVLGAVAGAAVLAVLVSIGILRGQAEFLLSHEPAGLLYLYPGPGATSTLAIFALPVALLLRESGQPLDRRLALALLGCIAVAGAGSQNRMVWPAAVITVFVYYFLQWPSLPLVRRKRLRFAAYAAIVGAIGIVAILSEARIQGFEARLRGWCEWGAVALEKPWTGFGLGKRIVGEVGGYKLTPEMQLADPAFVSHSHNLFLNTWLQVGAVGVGLYCLLLGAVAWYAFRGRSHAMRESGALLALLLGMLVKNGPDDFMDHAVVVGFWAYAGMLLGRLLSRPSSPSAAEIDTNAPRPQ